jgi:hypothetical protein
MGLIDAATAPLRYVLYGAEHEAAATADIARLEAHVVTAVDAIRETTEQLEAHAAVIERLAANLIPLTTAMTELSTQMPALVDSVGSLNAKLDVVSEVLEPLAHAEQDVAHAEHEVTRIGNIFSRHKTTPPAPDG